MDKTEETRGIVIIFARIQKQSPDWLNPYASSLSMTNAVVRFALDDLPASA
jgi:hypothetical protein